VAEIKNPDGNQRRPCVRLTMPSMPRYLSIIRAALRCMAKQEGFAEETVDQLVLATDEAITNVIKHGYCGEPDGAITVLLRPAAAKNRSGLEIVVLDRGQTVDPVEISGRDLADLRPGGLGVHIIRSVMDKVQYRCRAGGGMVLKMIKYHKTQPMDTQSDDRQSPIRGTP